MRRRGILLITTVLIAGLFIAACGERAAETTISCTVTEVYDNAVMAVCAEQNGTFAEGQRVYVSCETMPELAPGDIISVTFSKQEAAEEFTQILANTIEVK